MRKFCLFFIPLLFWGCDKTFENVIDVNRENYQVTSVSGIKDTVDLKIPSDSLLNLRLIFSSGSVVNSVHFNVIDPDDNFLNSSPIEMLSISDVIYENQFILKPYYPIGKYKVQFSVTGFDEVNRNVALGTFYFNNGQDNVAPVLSNLILPDSISREQSFIFTIQASDQNGLNDIEIVFFNLFRPDSSLVAEGPFTMHDDGDFEVFGDSIAGDGIYSFKNSFSATAQLGNWLFSFQAKDRSDSLSNAIEQLILVH